MRDSFDLTPEMEWHLREFADLYAKIARRIASSGAIDPATQDRNEFARALLTLTADEFPMQTSCGRKLLANIRRF
jgi:hypothetical protein